MKHIILTILTLAGAVLSAQDPIAQLKIPTGKNLLINPDFAENPNKKGQLIKWGSRKDIKLTWLEENGRKFLRAETSTPGYHLGLNQQMKNLKPETEYLLYLVARGKITNGSASFLYYEGKMPGVKKAVFAKGGGARKKDFPWQLFQVKFRTPADFKGGTFAVYAVLFHGITQVDIAQAGLIEQSATKLAPIPAGMKNLLNNPELKTSKQTPDFPYDWNIDYAENKQSFRYEQDKDGNGIVTLLPPVKKAIDNYGNNTVILKQNNMTLNPGQKYRIGAMIQTKNLKAARAAVVIYNNAWTQAVEIPLPKNTGTWKRIEKDVVLPKSPKEQYSFAVYTVGATAGEVKIKSPYLFPLDNKAATGIETAPVIHSLRKIVPVAPLLSRMSAEKPEMLFAYRSILPKPETDYECLVKIKSPEADNILAQGVFPLKQDHIHATFAKLAPGKIIVEAELKEKQTGIIIAKDSYTATLSAPVKLSRPVEKRLNMLTQRLLTVKAKDGDVLFSAPRDGWVYIALSQGKADTNVKLDGKSVIKAKAGRPFETLRFVKLGDHTLKLAETNGGTLLVNSIPEILVHSYPRKEKNFTQEGLHPDFLNHYIYPNTTTFGYGYLWQKKQLAELAEMGKEGRQQTMHARGRDRYESAEEMAKRFTNMQKQKNEVVRGNTFDEIYLVEIRAKWIITQALWQQLNRSLPMYVWSSGVKFDINGLNTAYLSSVANNANGKGKFLFECYARTQPDEKKAEIYLDDFLNEPIRRINQLMPGAAQYSLMILGCYSAAGRYCTDAYAGPDVKAFWNKVFYKWANDKEFKDLYGIGLYAWHQGNEESLRWVTKLIRHYVIEGNTEDLAAKYGYTYLPGHLKDGDFTEKLTHWTASGAVKAVTIKGLGGRYQARRWFPPTIGDTACMFTRSAKSPNKLTTKISGLTPGKQYVLRYLLVDNTDIKKNKASRKKLSLQVQLDGAKNVTASSPLAKHLNPEGINIRGYVNNVALVFKAEKPEVLLTFSDWADDKTPGAPIGQKIILNKVVVTPYFTE